MKAVMWARICGNTLVAFATSAIAINLAGAPEAITAAFYVAIMTGILAFAKELQDIDKGSEEKKSELGNILLF